VREHASIAGILFQHWPNTALKTPAALESCAAMA
jgi:hypothetical protein